MKQLENTLQDLKHMLEDGYKYDNIVLRTLIRAQQQVKNLINEPEKYTPKMGDFIYNEWTGSRYIDIYRNENDYFASFNIKTKDLAIGYSAVSYSSCSNIRPAAEDEKKMLLDALNEKGKDWDSEKMEFVDWKWRAKIGGKYWYLDSFFDVEYSIEDNHEVDTSRFNFGNYFRTGGEAEAYRDYCLAYKK